jgi:tetrahydromethanopterin S-methyltransferase subunit G
MATLDRVTQMQTSGMTDEQISSQLQQEGIAPQEVMDALGQAKIKSAVSDNPNTGVVQQTQAIPQLQANPPVTGTQGMQTSITEQATAAQAPLPPTEQAYQGQQYQETQSTQGQDDQYAGYYPEAGAYQEGYYQQPMMDTETITQIAEQVVAEKFKDFTKETGDLVSFKTTTQDKIADIDSRLKRIEKTIDKLQQAIIQKIGDFGESNAAIQKDIENLHETTSKLMNPLIDNYRAITEKKTNKRTTQKK